MTPAKPLSKVRVISSVVPDDGRDGFFWSDGDKWLRERGQEFRLLDIAPQAERLALMDQSEIERSAMELSKHPVPLPSDEERVAECMRSRSWGRLEILHLLAQVRAEASQEKDAEIERLSRAVDLCRAGREELFQKAARVSRDWQAAEAESAALRERVRVLEEALRPFVGLRLFVQVYDGRAFDRAKILAVIDAAERALAEPAPEKAPAPDLVGELVEALDRYRGIPDCGGSWTADNTLARVKAQR